MTSELATVARALVSGGRGILAIDESTKTCNQRFAKLGIAQTGEQRRAYRELLIGAPGIERYVSGMILYDETIRQSSADGQPFAELLRDRGMVPGIKVDTGTAPLPFTAGETVTEGLDGLRGRLAEYAALGAGFAKWRAVFAIADGTPSERAVRANAHALARYAALCQECGIVPIVEPEVLADGDHDLERCAQVTERVLRAVFAELGDAGVALEAMVLKPNMVLPGTASGQTVATAEVVSATLRVLGAAVPVAVAGVAFLSGGQDERAASERLCALNRACPSRRPWALTFSYGRALQAGALEHWAGSEERVPEARRILVHRAYCNGLAACGAYKAESEDRLARSEPAMPTAA
jgi:fructose-bisphosphate aldolase class I